MTDKDMSGTDTENLGEGWWASVMAEENNQNDESVSVQYESKENNAEENWSQIFQYIEEETVENYEVVDCNQGGLLVKSKLIRGFVPLSHLINFTQSLDDNEKKEKLKGYIGNTLKLKVIECDPKRGRIVMSERAGASAPGERQRLFRTLKPGMTHSGAVTNITHFGVFVDLGGIEGLIHLSEVSWGRVANLNDFINIGETVEVMILKLHEDKGRISLSLKQLQPNPWGDAHTRYTMGTTLQGQVVDIAKFGAFVKLEEDMEGLIHISEMALEGNESPWSILEVDQIVEIEIVKIDHIRQRIGLRLISK
ncbi:MAG: S1 RNA-binding domain-containing protein [Chloroflexota bacterium]